MSISSGQVAKVPPQAGFRATLKSRFRHILLALLALGAAAFFAPRLLFGPEVAAEKVTRGDLVESVVASGHVETPYRVEIGAQVTGVVAEVLVDEGQAVKQGQPVIRLEDSEARSALVLAQAARAQAQARLRQLKEVALPSAQENLKQARATLINAQAAYDRATTLVKNGFQTQVAVDEAQKALDIARTLVRTAELQVYTNSPGGSDFVVAETQLSQAEASVKTAEARLSYTTILSPRDGVLITRNVERGAVVQPGRALLVLAPTGDVQLVLQIDEKNLAKIALGQQALVSADAYPDKLFPAAVSYINPSVDITRASVEVKLVATDPPPFIRQDMTVSVDIQVARRDATLIAPARAVHDITSSPWVLVVRDGRAQKQPVTCGIRGPAMVEILSGLREGERLIPVTSEVTADERVRIKEP